MTRTALGLLRLGAYVRLSKAKGGGADIDTAVQLSDCEDKAAHEGGTIVKVYTENDTSAFKQKRVTLPDGTEGLRVRRDVFQELYRDLYAGEIDGFVGYHLDRIARQPRDLEDLIDLVTLRKVKIFGVASEIDLATDQGILSARLAVMIANQSSRDTSRRTSRKWRDMQENGLPGGGPRPFGFKADRITHEPAEAAAIRDAVESLINGGTLSGVAREWQARGLQTTLGNEWKQSSIKALLKNPRIAGIRARKVKAGWEEVRKADGTIAAAVWKPIVSREEWEALQAVLDANTARYKGGTRYVRKFLLAGITRCGQCGSRMVTQPATGGNRSHSYICPSPANGGCGSVSRHGEKVDEFVTEAVLVAVRANLSVEHAAPEVWTRQGELGLIDSQLTDSHAAWRAGKLSSADYFAVRDELQHDRKALIDERATFNAAHSAAQLPVNIADRWEDADLSEKRAAVERFIKAIVIHPLPVVDGRKVKRWNSDLIEVVPA